MLESYNALCSCSLLAVIKLIIMRQTGCYCYMCSLLVFFSFPYQSIRVDTKQDDAFLL